MRILNWSFRCLDGGRVCDLAVFIQIIYSFAVFALPLPNLARLLLCRAAAAIKTCQIASQ